MSFFCHVNGLNVEISIELIELRRKYLLSVLDTKELKYIVGVAPSGSATPFSRLDAVFT